MKGGLRLFLSTARSIRSIHEPDENSNKPFPFKVSITCDTERNK